MSELRDIGLFVEVARLRSFTRAAARLGVPASTLSRRISGLEAILAVALFTRTTRRVELTEAGHRYLLLCEQIIEAASAARDELHQLSQTPRGTLRVTMSPDIGAVYLAPAIAGFSRRYPGISLQIDLSPRRIDIIAEGFDLAIRIGAPAEPYLIASRLFLAQRGLFAAPSFLARHRKIRSPAELVDLPCVTIDHPDAPSVWRLSCGHDRAEIAPRGMLTANNPRMVLELAAEGCGFAVGDKKMADGAIASGRLVRVLPEWAVDPVAVFAVTASRVVPAKLRLFIDHLRAELAA